MLWAVRTGELQSRCEENMGKLKEFVITFDKDKVVYSPGESISGTVTIKLGQALQCKGKSALILRLGSFICTPGGKTSAPLNKEVRDLAKMTWDVIQPLILVFLV